MKRLFVLVLSVVLLFAGMEMVGPGTVRANNGETAERLTAQYEKDSIRLAGRDWVPPLNFPEMDSAERGDHLLEDNDWVIGISRNGEQKAYPVKVLGVHELANDTVGGDPIAVCW